MFDAYLMKKHHIHNNGYKYREKRKDVLALLVHEDNESN